MRTKDVTVLPYTPQWAEAFLTLRDALWEALEGVALAIEHVGSTSVPGMWAKPILDVDVVLPDSTSLPEAIYRLQQLGYLYEGDLGIAGREAFSYVALPRFMAHHLYVCPQDSPELHRHLTFRDHLRSHSDARERYSEVKREAAQLFPRDIDRYMQYKSGVIAQLYRECGLT